MHWVHGSHRGTRYFTKASGALGVINMAMRQQNSCDSRLACGNLLDNFTQMTLVTWAGVNNDRRGCTRGME
jgi:hypothetical protein